MAEVLGAVAAAAQLTATCLALIELTKRIKERSSTLEGYHNQLLQLHHLSESISSNPLLQTPEIELHTRNIISLLSHQTLESSLKKSRVSQIILFFSQDRSIARLFNDLERHKSTLSLVINEIQSRALHQIQNNLVNMSGEQKSFQNAAVDQHPPAESYQYYPQQLSSLGESVSTTSSTIIKTGHVFPDDSMALERYRTGSGQSPTGDRHQPTRSSSRNPRIAETEEWLDFYRAKFGPDLAPSTWVGCVASGNMSQFNGTVFDGEVEISPDIKMVPTNDQERYYGCLAVNGDYQMNGTSLPLRKGTAPKTILTPGGRYLGCQPLDHNYGSGGRQTIQVNGVHYRALPPQPEPVRTSGMPKQE